MSTPSIKHMNKLFAKKHTILLLLFLLSMPIAYSQTGSTITPTDACINCATDIRSSAVMEIRSSTKGLLIPRMSATQRDAISNPVKGLLVFVNSSNSFWFYDGTAWVSLAGIAGPAGPAGATGATGSAGPAGPAGATGAKGATGAQGPPGTAGGQACWDLNGNALADIATEDMNGDGTVNILDCHGIAGPPGPQGPAGPAGATGATGVQGPPGTAGGQACWDLNGNSLPDLAEDVNNDGTVNIFDCHGLTGPQGRTGPAGATGARGATGAQGPPGIAGGQACWDLNGNDQADLATEDVNGDGLVNIYDCHGVQGPAGPAGAQGPAGPAGPAGPTGATGVTGAQGPPGIAGGQACWDLNGNDQADVATEDVNGDGTVNILDCHGATGAQGPAGATGAQGPAGPAGATGARGATGATGAQGPPGIAGGQACWDLNGNDVADLATEDVNGDGTVNIYDCHGIPGPAGPQGANGPAGPAGATGAQGPQGPAGSQGPPGTAGGQACWDLNGNDVADLATEDVNGDGTVNIYDCHGATGPQGPAGATGAQGPAGPVGATGAKGAKGDTGSQGPPGTAGGQACWDTNGNGIPDASEDVNNDGTVNVYDCHGAQGPAGATGASGPQGPAGPCGCFSEEEAAEQSKLGPTNTATKSTWDLQEQTIAIQEQRIEELETKMGQMVTLLEALISQKSEADKEEYFLSMEQEAILAQNRPNPFYENTIINYFIPATIKKASLQVTTIDGRIIETFPIYETGSGEVLIRANAYDAGLYQYTLLLDGKVFETKRMVLTK